MLSDEEIEQAAEVVADALARFPDLKTNLAKGLVSVAALEDAGYIVERLDPGPPALADYLGAMLRASLEDRGALQNAVTLHLLDDPA